MAYTWLKNVGKHQVDAVIEELCRGRPGRKLVVGDPKATKTNTIEQIASMDGVGIYETDAEKTMP